MYSKLILSYTEYMDITYTSIKTHTFTSVLQHYPGSPQNLYIAGEIPKKRTTTVAIVGSRRPTSYGKETTYKLAYDLAKQGVVVVSGLAYGIDAHAHRGALDAGGTTIAILAGGLDIIYPKQHTALAKQIINAGGALISEYKPGSTVYKSHFLARNRIVSGLSDAVVITEAAQRSGTLATVSHALSQGKDVFAVPGNVTSSLSVGPNRLIQQGAHIAMSANDILHIIAPHLVIHPQTKAAGATPAEKAILQLLQKGIRDGEILQQQSGLTISDYLQAMTMLEINDIIRPLGGDRWAVL